MLKLTVAGFREQVGFKGKVQGVGFRWTVVEKALEFQLRGTVQNLSNGSVEIVAQGEKKNSNMTC